RLHLLTEVIIMFESFALLFPADWQGAVLTLLAPMRWLAAWQSTIATAWLGGSSAGQALAWIALLMPALLLAAGMWCTVASIYTLPFRSRCLHHIDAHGVVGCWPLHLVVLDRNDARWCRARRLGHRLSALRLPDGQEHLPRN